MRTITESDLILYCLGESPRSKEIERALAEDAALAATCDELRAVLQAVKEGDAVPERPPDYEQRVWQRLEWKLDEATTPWWKRWLSAKALAPAAAVAALVLVAFVVGRWGPGAPAAPELNAAVRERILLVDMSQHLGDAEMVLVEVMNADGGSAELASVRERAGELLSSNRLYRQVTSDEGEDRTMRAVLDELDRVLTELRNTPERDGERAFVSLQGSLRESGTLFKVRVLRTKVQEQAKEMQPGRTSI